MPYNCRHYEECIWAAMDLSGMQRCGWFDAESWGCFHMQALDLMPASTWLPCRWLHPASTRLVIEVALAASTRLSYRWLQPARAWLSYRWPWPTRSWLPFCTAVEFIKKKKWTWAPRSLLSLTGAGKRNLKWLVCILFYPFNLNSCEIKLVLEWTLQYNKLYSVERGWLKRILKNRVSGKSWQSEAGWIDTNHITCQVLIPL